MAEIELKFEVAAADRERLAGARALAAGEPRQARIESWYFDTADCALARNRMALRLRRAGSRWVQTLKSGASGTGGLHVRDEWEFERDAPEIDLSLFADTPLARLRGARKLHRTLLPAFRVDMQRRTWHLDPAQGCRLEVALDEGTVASGERSDAISELEIECLEGDPACAFAVARALLDEVPMRPSATTKAERGYRLFRGARLRPHKARPVRLASGASPLEAARAIIGAGLAQLQANEEGVLRTPNPEFVHQARVALRRMRSALRMFPAAIGEAESRRWRDELGEATRALGDARDWDVFATETLPALGEAYGEAAFAGALRRRVAAHRARHRAAARAALLSARYARVVLEIAEWLARPTAQAAALAAPAESLPAFASRVIRKRHKRLVEGIARLGEMSVEERHRARIRAKRLRYAVEGLASVFPERRASTYAKRLADLQDALGRANDAVTGERLLGELAPAEPFAMFARGWLAARMRGDAELLDALGRHLAESKRFWRRRREAIAPPPQPPPA